ncbi:hypothetical protein AB0M48_27315 [Lentzea sp. NPDC051208]|uniref:hypothetical protein n=1 Tax=Lentzea sp. NPDC051208 TaxID=3154642 RepID=UPI0034441E10
MTGLHTFRLPATVTGSGDDIELGRRYGTHFTSMFMRCHPDRVTTRRIVGEDRLTVLSELRSGTLHS